MTANGLAATHEFGTGRSQIPARPFMRIGAELHRRLEREIRMAVNAYDMPLHDAAHTREAIMRVCKGQVSFDSKRTKATAIARIVRAGVRHGVTVPSMIVTMLDDDALLAVAMPELDDEALLWVWRDLLSKSIPSGRVVKATLTELASRPNTLAAADVIAGGGSHADAVDIYRKSRRGDAPAWARATFYAVGAMVITERGDAYRCIDAGTSSARSKGPRGVGTGIFDGTVTWSSV